MTFWIVTSLLNFLGFAKFDMQDCFMWLYCKLLNNAIFD